MFIFILFFSEHLPNKTDLICEVLTSIADVLIDIGELRAAKNKLRKAYNLKCSNVVDQEAITHSLKTGNLNRDRIIAAVISA